MTTSGSTDFSMTRNDIISDALRKCGQLAEGETATAQQVSDASRDLNRLVKSWQKQGLKLWKSVQLVAFMEMDKKKYSIPGDRVVYKDALVETTLSAAAADTDTTITITSATGVSNGYYIGVVVDDKTIHWTTVSNIAGTTVTLASALDDDAASGNAVYVFSSYAPRPLAITHGTVRIDENNETELTIVGQNDYFSIANKTATGPADQIYYHPSLTAGGLYVWPVSDDESIYLNLTGQMPIDDFDSASNTPDLPQEWYLPLVWNLASQIYTEYGLTDQVTIMKIEKEAEKWYESISSTDTDDASIVFIPDI